MFLKNIFHYSLYLIISLVFLVAGCSDDDNPVDNSEESEHFHAVGSKLVLEDQDIITADTADSSDVVGLIEIHEGESLEFEAWFLDDEGNWFYPADESDHHQDHELEVVMGNGDLISGEIQDWNVTLSGLSEGTSWIRLKVKHIDHYGYISPHLRLVVHHEEGHHSEPVGMRLFSNDQIIVEIDAHNNVTGSLSVPVQGTLDNIEAFFFDENGVQFQPDDDHSLSITIENTQIVEYTQASLWVFSLQGTETGNTNLEIALNHGDHSHYSSPSIPVIVE